MKRKEERRTKENRKGKRRKGKEKKEEKEKRKEREKGGKRKPTKSVHRYGFNESFQCTYAMVPSRLNKKFLLPPPYILSSYYLDNSIHCLKYSFPRPVISSI